MPSVSYRYESSITAEKSTAMRASRGILSTPMSAVLCVCLFVFILFENPLEPYVPGLNYFDEAIFAITVVVSVLLLAGRRIRLDTREIRIGVLCLAICILGLCGNLLESYQENLTAIISEGVAFLKFPLTLVAMYVIMDNVQTDRVIEGCAGVSKIFILVCAIACVMNFVSPIELFSHDVRNGIVSFKFIYTHPTFLVFSLVLAYVALDAKDKRISPIKVICLIVLAMTMRDKAFGFIAFVIVSWALGLSKKKSIVPYLLLAGTVVVWVAWPKISEYMSWSSSPREALYRTSLQIALASFPYGGGFASIASSLSGEYYSGAYYVFGLSGMQGLTPFEYIDAGDAGFAYYIGQFGIIGTALFVAVLVTSYKLLVSRLPLGSSRRSAIIAMFAYILIAMTVETVLTNATGAMAAILLSFIASGNEVKAVAETSSLNSVASDSGRER